MKNAIILAAGLGSRLLPLTDITPKPLVPVANKPILFYTLNLLKKYGTKSLAINLFHLPEQIIEWTKLDSICSNFEIHFSLEKKIRGTGGGIKHSATLLDGPPFLVINGDILIDLDLDRLMAFHRGKKSILTLVLREDPMSSAYGVIKIDEKNRIRQFLDHSQPGWHQNKRHMRNLMYTGVQLIEAEFLKYIPESEFSDLSREVYPQMVVENLPVYGYIMDNYWNDLGTPGRYFQANRDCMKSKLPLLLDEKGQRLDRRHLGEDDAMVRQPVVLGQHLHLGRHVTIGPEVAVSKNVILGNRVTIEKSIVWENVCIGDNVNISGCILLSNIRIPPGMNLNKMIAFKTPNNSLELIPLTLP